MEIASTVIARVDLQRLPEMWKCQLPPRRPDIDPIDFFAVRTVNKYAREIK